MEKPRKILIIFVTLGVISFGNFVFAQDQNILVKIYNESTGHFENLGDRPIFNVENFAPGDTITKKIRVYNYTQDPQTIGLKVTNFERGCQNNFCLADQLILTIQENATSHYSGSLTDFYNAGEVPLSEVRSEEYNEYELSVYFKPESGSEYQDLSTTFDLEIGFFTKETVSGEGASPVSAGGGYTPLFIPEVVTIINITSPPAITPNSATITCTTNIPAFCRVIYDTTSHPVLGNPPNYGYQWSTDATPKATAHTIKLTGLLPNTTYYYRVVCWASPYKITREYSFLTLGIKEEEKPAPPTEEEIEEEIEEEKPPEVPLYQPIPGEAPPEGEITPSLPTQPAPTPPFEQVLPTLPRGVAAPTTFFGANLAAAIKDIVSSWPKLTLVVVLLLILAGIFGRRVYLFAKRKRQKS